jgi:predicted metal-dependent hydrolase
MEVLNQYGKIAKTIAIRPDNNNSDKLFAYIECETKKDADNIYENRYKVYIDGVKLKINRFEYRKNKHK